MDTKSKALVIIILVLLLGFLVYLSSSFYQIFALSVIVAYFVYPLKKKLFKKIRNETVVSLMSMIIGFSILSTVIVIFVTSLYNGFVGIASFASEAQNIQLINSTINLFDSLNVQQPLTQAGLTQLASFIQNLFFFAPQLALSMFVFLFFLFYFIKYGEEIIEAVRGIVPPAEIKYFDKFTNRLNSMMKAIFQGQFITSLVQSVVLFVFLLFLGTPYAFELTFFTFLLCFFNITVAIVPTFLTIFYLYQGYLMGDYTLFLINVIFLLFITTIDNVIKPLIGEKTASFNPVFFILGLTGGALTLGFTGFIIGPLIFGMFQAALEILFENKKINFV